MRIPNYLQKLNSKFPNLYIQQNEDSRRLISETYQTIKTQKNRSNLILSGCSRTTIGDVVRGKSALSLELINNMNTFVKWNLWDRIFEVANYIRGKTNSDKIKLPKKLTPDLCYLFGAIRDGSLSCHKYELEFTQKNRKWLSHSVKKRLENVFGITVKIKGPRSKDGCYIVRKRSNALHSILMELLSYKKSHQPTPPILLKAPFALQKFYIAGFYDAEGRKSRRDLNLYQQWFDKNCQPLIDIKRMLQKNNINTTFHKPKVQKGGVLSTLHIPRKSGIKFLKSINLEHPHLHSSPLRL